MSRRNAPEKFFSAVRGCPRPCARTNPWFRGQLLGEKCAQEPTPGSAVKHCRFMDRGGYILLPTHPPSNPRPLKLIYLQCIRTPGPRAPGGTLVRRGRAGHLL